jgi:phosphohistidine phosphatase
VRQLWILRHAKAAAEAPSDRERPLTDKGRRQCASLAAAIPGAGLGPMPGLVLSSSATRARQTAELVVGALGGPPLELEHELYEADPDDVVDRLRLLDDDGPEAVLVVGHNPTMAELVAMLLADDGRDRSLAGFPTCALAVIEVPAERWRALSFGEGRLRAVLRGEG